MYPFTLFHRKCSGPFGVSFLFLYLSFSFSLFIYQYLTLDAYIFCAYNMQYIDHNEQTEWTLIGNDYIIVQLKK